MKENISEYKFNIFSIMMLGKRRETITKQLINEWFSSG